VKAAPILVMAGGTGGHVYPALAVAQAIRERSLPVVWLGTHRGLEARVVPAAGFDIEWISVGGLRGKGAATLLLAPFRLALPRSSAWAASSADRAALPPGSSGGLSLFMNRMPSPA